MIEQSKEEKKGFTISDKRFSTQSGEENKTADAEKIKSKVEQVENLAKIKETSAPEIDFTAFVLSLCTSALIQLGEVVDPITNKADKNIDAAKQTIDLLGILQDKTKGNLTKQEKAVLDNALYDLRIKFISRKA